ncbi:MAG: hypothetical protein K9N09_04200 [Candidatus Cloacimonetes bacterium]|nr:hypothetical protein [Candidatus Cloacimonadota bacterium]MCF7814489.1 hypothetical protein [Candidatus Cloacimonadota bacterium]MCF7867881.1 hypothetical protein [Candidatus Cloacimonadota bacterium]MCF7883700.1 hypothetical protein [Candidatus Cloacimonadota bacterium]
MKKMIVPLLIAIALSFGCTKECELKIYNDTPIMQKAKIDGIIYEIQSNGTPAVEEYYLDSYLLLSETQEVAVEYVANSPISYRSPKTFKVEMKPGKNKTYHIKYDRGRIQMRNISPLTLDQILLKKEGSNEWSEDLYDGVLLPDEIDEIAIKAGNYTMKLIDAYGVEYPLVEIEIIAGEQLMHFFTGEM